MTIGSTTPAVNAAQSTLSVPGGIDEPRALAAATRLDEFEIVRLLGVGGFGIVYLALDHSLMRYVAIKEYMPAGLATRGAAGTVRPRLPASTPQFDRGLESFFNEARLLARFSHPALVRVYRFWKTNGTAYMAMQYYPGSTLKDVRSAMRSPPDEAWLRAFIDPLLGALERLHAEGVFHRDISPDNILLLPNGRPVLLDFGAARRVIGHDTRGLTAVVKPNFAPIEQYGDEAGLSQGPWTDLYAVAATAHFVLTGTAPMPAVMRSVKDLRKPLAAADPAAFPGVGRAFLAAIDWASALSPHDRPQSVGAFLQALDGQRRLSGTTSSLLARNGVTRGGLVKLLASVVVFGAIGLVAWAPGLRNVPVATAPAKAEVAMPLSTVPAPSAIAPAPTVRVARDAASGDPLAAAAPPVSAPIDDLDKPFMPAARSAAPRHPPVAHKPMRSTPATHPPSSLGSTAASQNPAQACAGRNFISRAVCMSRLCSAMAWRAHPDCAEVGRIEEQRQRRVEP